MATIKGGGFEWCVEEAKGGDQWVGTTGTPPPRIKQLDAGTFACYRDGRYLGCEGDIKAAFARVEVNVRSERNREMEWQRAHPDEQPLGLRLTQAEREAHWASQPPPRRPQSHIAAAPRKQAGVSAPPATGGTVKRSPAYTASDEKWARETGAIKEPRTKGDGRNKTAIIAELLLREGGCTSEEVLRATGWTAVSMPQQAKTAGLALRVDKARKPFRYYAVKETKVVKAKTTKGDK